MEGQVVQVVAPLHREGLLADLQQNDDAGQDLEGDHADLQALFAQGKAQNRCDQNHNAKGRKQGADVLGCPKLHTNSSLFLCIYAVF